MTPVPDAAPPPYPPPQAGEGREGDALLIRDPGFFSSLKTMATGTPHLRYITS
jgi:hypothetical protein